MEVVFDGPITTIPPQPPYAPNAVSWLDIVSYARENPREFVLSSISDRERACQFSLKGLQVKISEDDWRVIVSGTLDRFKLVPSHPLEEDETVELATLEILEQRLQTLIKRADEVAKKARQLNYQLSGRTRGIKSRMVSQQQVSQQQPSGSGSGPRPGFHTGSQQQSGLGVGAPYDLHADLLQQFQSPTSQPVTSRTSSIAAAPVMQSNHPSLTPPNPAPPAVTTPSVSSSNNNNNRPSPIQLSESSARESSNPDDQGATTRPLITGRLERLIKGEQIFPPCDRCRRLKVQCVKNLTACSGCTKKHAKCSWKAVTTEELEWLRREATAAAEAEYEYGPLRYSSSRRYRRELLPAEPRESQEPTSGGLPPDERSRPTSRGDYNYSPQEAGGGLPSSSGPPAKMGLDYEQHSEARGNALGLRDHSLLSQVASAATAAADAREAQEAREGRRAT
jgi:hypothetical protein